MTEATHHFFDEAGDTGFKFTRGSSLYWAGVLVATDKPWMLRDEIAALKSQSGFEFRFHNLNERAKRRFFAAIESHPFLVRAVVVDKRRLPASFRRLSRLAFYSHFITELVLRAPDEAIRNDILILDDSTKQLKRALRVHLSKHTRELGLSRRFKKIVARESARDNAVQCADMIVGAVVEMWLRGDRLYYDTFRDKVVDLFYAAGK